MSNSFVISWTITCQVPLSVGFLRQDYWSGLPFSSPGNLPDPGIQTRVCCIDRRALYSWAIIRWDLYLCWSVTQSCLTLCDPMDHSTPGFPVHHHPPEFSQTHVHWVIPSNHLVLCHPLLLLLSIFPSIRVFSNESALHIRWTKYWSFSFSISPSNKYSGLISFKMHWLDLLAVQGTLKSLLQHHSSKASILWGSAFFMVQLLHGPTSIHDWENHSFD